MPCKEPVNVDQTAHESSEPRPANLRERPIRTCGQASAGLHNASLPSQAPPSNLQDLSARSRREAGRPRKTWSGGHRDQHRYAEAGSAIKEGMESDVLAPGLQSPYRPGTAMGILRVFVHQGQR